MKVCTSCKEEKPKSEYYKHKDGIDGLRPTCKKCISEYGKKYRGANQEECNRRSRDWAVRNPDKVKAIHERYKENNPESYRNKWLKRRTVKQKLKYDFSPHISIRIRKMSNRTCAITGSDETHLDHFIPMNTGHGGTYEGNLVLLSKQLNLSKGDRNPFEWAETLSPEQRRNFDKIVEYLAELNELTVDEYREFVFWCFENKRDIDEINDDNRDSLALWKRMKSAA